MRWIFLDFYFLFRLKSPDQIITDDFSIFVYVASCNIFLGYIPILKKFNTGTNKTISKGKKEEYFCQFRKFYELFLNNVRFQNQIFPKCQLSSLKTQNRFKDGFAVFVFKHSA